MSNRSYIADAADTSTADVLPLVRDFLISALEERGQGRLIDPDTDERLFTIDATGGEGPEANIVTVSRYDHAGDRVALFTLTIDFADEIT